MIRPGLGVAKEMRGRHGAEDWNQHCLTEEADEFPTLCHLTLHHLQRPVALLPLYRYGPGGFRRLISVDS